jgi:hypothetical protein
MFITANSVAGLNCCLNLELQLYYSTMVLVPVIRTRLYRCLGIYWGTVQVQGTVILQLLLNRESLCIYWYAKRKLQSVATAPNILTIFNWPSTLT